MKAIALADFGSTFTKVTIVEEGSGRLLGQGRHETTVGSDVMRGYGRALEHAVEGISGRIELVVELAASSAAGGLRMATAGLVDELTAAAARQASLNAGAKVELVLAGDLQPSDSERLSKASPEILMFCGGTDGGQAAKVLANARVLAHADPLRVVVVACNNRIAHEVAAIFHRPDRLVQVVDNVLPDIDRLDIGAARTAIHELFIRHVIGGKGLSSDRRFESLVVMPTPEAVLDAVRLLAFGVDGNARTAGVVVVDIGGATTDVHSAAHTDDIPAFITSTGLPNLPLTRTVQGDLGLRWSADSVVAADRPHLLARLAHVGIDNASLADHACRRHDDPGMLATTAIDEAVDEALAETCISLALQRHCGTLTTVYLPGQGTQFVQRGLDLRSAPVVVGTGGALVHRDTSHRLLARAIERRFDESLTPRSPAVVIDRHYLLSAIGLLASHDIEAADRLLNHLREEILHDTRHGR